MEVDEQRRSARDGEQQDERMDGRRAGSVGWVDDRTEVENDDGLVGG